MSKLVSQKKFISERKRLKAERKRARREQRRGAAPPATAHPPVGPGTAMPGPARRSGADR
jgi:hypothetical protein